MADSSSGRSMADLKNDHKFDEFLADMLASRIKQPQAIDVERALKEIKKEINPGLHDALKDDN